MHVYKINQFYIAAKDADSAFGEFMSHTDSMEDIFIGDLKEDEEESLAISIKRLSEARIKAKSHPCCGDDDYGCDLCSGEDDTVWVSLQDMINEVEENNFPEVLCWEI